MPTPLHEALRELFNHRPEQLVPLIADRVRLPVPVLVPAPSELTDPRPTQLLPDAVLACPRKDAPQAIVIVEAQLSIDPRKRRAWPHYAAAAHNLYRCRAEVIVVTPEPSVERWASQPIQIGNGHVMVPTVYGPSSLPRMTRDEIEATPALGMICTLGRMNDEQAAQQALWTFEALARWEGDAEGRLADILQAALSIGVRQQIEDLMRTGHYEYQSEFARKYFSHGQQEARANSLLVVLRARGLAVDEQIEQRIKTESDPARLEAWIVRAATASQLEDVFEQE